MNFIKSLMVFVLNIFIFDYGLKLIFVIYICGIGLCINILLVGLYVDNVFYIDKLVFDFNYVDIECIDVLCGL